MDTKLTGKTRIESDLIGAREIPAEALYGVQTLRGIENFSISKFRLSEYHTSLRSLRPFELYGAPPPICIYYECSHDSVLLLRQQIYGIFDKQQIKSYFFYE